MLPAVASLRVRLVLAGRVVNTASDGDSDGEIVFSVLEVGVSIGGIDDSVGGIDDSVGEIGVSVGGIGVSVGEIGGSFGGIGVSVSGTILVKIGWIRRAFLLSVSRSMKLFAHSTPVPPDPASKCK